MTDYKNLLFKFITSLILCEHMGDVCNEISLLLRILNIDIEEEGEFLDDLYNWCRKNKLTTLNGVELEDE